MTEQQLTRFLYILMTVGAVLVLTGVGLVMLTEITTDYGMKGMVTVTGVIGVGLFCLLPSKLFLTLQLMKKKDESAKAEEVAKGGAD